MAADGWSIGRNSFYDLHIYIPLELSFYFLLPMEWDPVWLYVAWKDGIRLYCELQWWTRHLRQGLMGAIVEGGTAIVIKKPFLQFRCIFISRGKR